MNKALGIIEVIGFGCAVNISDVMAKTANVEILDIEKAKGSGWLAVKVIGDVGAVNAAVESGVASAKMSDKYVASLVIPRVAEGLEAILVEQKESVTVQPTVEKKTETPKSVAPKEAVPPKKVETVKSDTNKVVATESIKKEVDPGITKKVTTSKPEPVKKAVKAPNTKKKPKKS